MTYICGSKVFDRIARRMSDFLGFYVSENVVTEHSRAAEELVFGMRQFYTGTELELDEMQRADEIRQLKQAVAGRPYVVCKLHDSSDAGLEHLVKHAGYRRLPAVVVYLNASKRRNDVLMPRNEIRKVGLEASKYLVGGINELLVYAQAMVSIVNPSCECHHAREDSPSKLSAEHGVVLLAPNERPGVKAMSLKPDFSVGAFKNGEFAGYVDGLVVEHHADDVEAGLRVWESEVPRFVYENAQCLCFHSTLLKKREWRDKNPATHAESFPRIPVTPSRRKRSARIVAYPPSARKRAMPESSSLCSK